MMTLEQTFKVAVLVVFILAPIFDFFVARPAFIALMAFVKLRKRNEYYS